MSNQLIIKGAVVASSTILASNIQNSNYTMPSTIGSEGQVLKVVSGQLVWSNATDNDGVIGPLTYNFDHSSPITLFTAPAGTMIADVIIEIVTPFSDSSSTLSVGDSVNSGIIMAASEIDLSAASGQIFRGSPGYVYTSTTAVLLTLDPKTSTSGSFKVTLSYLQ